MNEDEVLQLNFKKAYDIFVSLQREIPDYEKYHDYITYGTNIRFDVREWFKGNVAEKSKDSSTRIGKYWYHNHNIYDELERREYIVKKVLRTYFASKTIQV